MNDKKPQRFSQYILPKLEDVLFITVLGMCFLFGTRMLSIDSDVGRHISIGNYILETKYIPTQDILSHTKLSESRPPCENTHNRAYAELALIPLCGTFPNLILPLRDCCKNSFLFIKFDLRNIL